MADNWACTVIVLPAILMVAACLAPSLGGQSTDPSRPPIREAVAPTYPGLAAQSGTQGQVKVRLVLRASGQVEGAEVTEGHKILRSSALSCARSWSFEPGAEGRVVTVSFEFRIMPKGTTENELAARFRPDYTVEVRRIVPEAMINSDPPANRPKR